MEGLVVVWIAFVAAAGGLLLVLDAIRMVIRP